MFPKGVFPKRVFPKTQQQSLDTHEQGSETVAFPAPLLEISADLAVCPWMGFEQATGLERLGASDDLLDLGVDSLMSVAISAVRAQSLSPSCFGVRRRKESRAHMSGRVCHSCLSPFLFTTLSRSHFPMSRRVGVGGGVVPCLAFGSDGGGGDGGDVAQEAILPTKRVAFSVRTWVFSRDSFALTFVLAGAHMASSRDLTTTLKPWTKQGLSEASGFEVPEEVVFRYPTASLIAGFMSDLRNKDAEFLADAG